MCSLSKKVYIENWNVHLFQKQKEWREIFWQCSSFLGFRLVFWGERRIVAYFAFSPLFSLVIRELSSGEHRLNTVFRKASNGAVKAKFSICLFTVSSWFTKSWDYFNPSARKGGIFEVLKGEALIVEVFDLWSHWIQISFQIQSMEYNIWKNIPVKGWSTEPIELITLSDRQIYSVFCYVPEYLST